MLKCNHWLLLVVVADCVQPLLGMKGVFERVEQFLGDEYIDLDLRVRKFNRTTTTLNGTIYINVPIDDTISFSSNVFLSRLGNQQFQHYPLHLPTGGLCDLVQHLQGEYASAIADIVNMPNASECPVSKRALYIQDKLVPMDVIPDSLSSGLWKMVISGALNETVVIRFMISMRLSDEYGFGF